jgi:hypothetical protein
MNENEERKREREKERSKRADKGSFDGQTLE